MAIRKKSKEITNSDSRPSGVTAKYCGKMDTGRWIQIIVDRIRCAPPVITSNPRPMVGGRKNAAVPVRKGIRKTISTMQ